MAKLTQEEFEKRFYSIFDSNEWEIIGKYINNNTPIKIRHIPCGTVISRTWVNLQKETCYCPACDSNKNSKIVVKGVNDIATSNPALFLLLANKEDGYKYKEHSNKYAWFQCPYCGKLHYKMINNVARQGLSCECCSENISYAEKFFISLLNQLDIDYEYQYSPDWIKPLRYDFCIKHIKYIIELDGGLGHGYGGFNEELYKKSLIYDEIKNNKAIENGFKIIRIDCNYDSADNKFQYIRDNIIRDCFSILDISHVDFNKCNKDALLKNCEYISNLWNSGIRGYQNIQKYLPFARATIRGYLKDASEIGLIKEPYDEILNINRKISNEQLKKSKGCPVKCNETGEIFVSISEAAREYKKYHAGNLLGYFSRNSSYCGILPDGTKLTWQKIENDYC